MATLASAVSFLCYHTIMVLHMGHGEEYSRNIAPTSRHSSRVMYELRGIWNSAHEENG